MAADTITLSLDQIRELALTTLKANGCNDENASAVAETITTAERDGSSSHGLFRLPGYVASLKSGKANGSAKPSISRPKPAVVLVDNDQILRGRADGNDHPSSRFELLDKVLRQARRGGTDVDGVECFARTPDEGIALANLESVALTDPVNDAIAILRRCSQPPLDVPPRRLGELGDVFDAYGPPGPINTATSKHRGHDSGQVA